MCVATKSLALKAHSFELTCWNNKKNCLRYSIRTENDVINDLKQLTEQIPKTHGYGNITRILYVYPNKIDKEYTIDDIMDIIIQSYSTTQ